MKEITLAFDESVDKDIENLKDYYHLSSQEEVFRRGLVLLKFAARQEKEGSGLLIKKDNDLVKVSVK